MSAPPLAPADLDHAIVDLVSRDAVKVPPYPAVAFRIERLLREGDYGLEDLARLVASDQVLAADVLRCANSAAYARGTPVVGVPQAVSRIGAKDVARVALASGLGAEATAPGRLAPLRRRAWLDALASAMLCQALARGRGLAADEAFAAGLLHDFGRVIAIACIEELLERHPDFPPSPAAEWEAVIDRYHVELGVVLAARWELPPLLSDVLSLHHAEDLRAAAEPRMVELVAAVDQVARLLEDRTHLTAEDLGIVSLLSAAECGVVAKALEALPGFIASFESGETAAEAAPSLIAPPAPPPRRTGPRPPPCPVTLVLGAHTQSYRILGIASTHVMLSGAAPMPENTLLELRIGVTPPVTGFASVKLAWQEGPAYTLLVQPYALTGDALLRWKELVQASTAEIPG